MAVKRGSRGATPLASASPPGPASGSRNRRHWEEDLDPQNLESRGRARRFRYREEFAHWDTTEQRWALDRMGPLKGRRVLEIGGGLGVGAAALGVRGARVIILDISLARAKKAMAALRREGYNDPISIVVGAAEDLPFRSGAFHVVTTKSVLIHCDLARAAREIHRVLRPGGRALHLEPLDDHPLMNIYRRFFAPKAWKSITKYFNRSRAALFARPFGGLGPNVRLRHFQFLGAASAFVTYGPFRNRRLRRISETFLDPLDRLLTTLLPPLRWKSWFLGIEAVHRAQIGHAPSDAGASRTAAPRKHGS